MKPNVPAFSVLTCQQPITIINAETLKQLFTALVRPHLEFSNSVWSPQFEKDKKIGKIVKLNMGRDNEIRSAKILLPSRVLITRPLNLVYPLETAGVRNVVEHEP